MNRYRFISLIIVCACIVSLFPKPALADVASNNLILDFTCSLGGILEVASSGCTNILEWLAQTIIGLLILLLLLFMNSVNIFLRFSSIILSEIFLLGNFTTNPFVQNTARYLLNFINLAFIVGFLYIAAMNLISPGSYDFKKPLIRLLTAALLVNFSLVICGVLIDASRLLMAVELRMLTPGGVGIPDNLGEVLLTGVRPEYPTNPEQPNLPLAPTVFNARYEFAYDGWFITTNFRIFEVPLNLLPNYIIELLIGAVSLIGVTAGIVYLSIGLIIRYFFLLLLCAVAPAPYLGLIFDNLKGKITEKWWSYFIKYLLYGPIALFILIILFQSLNAGQFNLNFDFTEDNSVRRFFPSLFSALAACILFIGAAITATKATGFSTSGVTNFFKNHKRGLANVATLGGFGLASSLANSAARQANDFRKTASDNIRSNLRDKAKKNSLTSWMIPAKRDKDGNLKPGEDSYGARLARNITPYKNEKVKNAAQDAAKMEDPAKVVKDARAAAKNNKGPGPTDAEIEAAQTAVRESPHLQPDKLQDAKVAAVLNQDQIEAIFTHGTLEQMRALARHKEVTRTMSDAQRSEISNRRTNYTTADINPDTGIAYTAAQAKALNETNKYLRTAIDRHLTAIDNE